MSDITKLLSAWGKWARQHSDSLGYGQPMDAIMRGAPFMDADDLVVGVRRYDDADFITDEKALVIDRMVGVLCQVRPVDGKCLRLKYERGLEAKAIAHGYLTELKYGATDGQKVDERKASQHIAGAEGFIDGMLFERYSKIP